MAPKGQGRTEQRLLATAVFGLLAYGAVMVYSAASATAVLESGSTGLSYLLKFLGFAAVGLVGMAFCARRGVALVPRLAGPAVAVCLLLVVAVHIPGIGVAVNGGRRWIGRGPLRFEPAELLKLALILYAASLLARRPEAVRSLSTVARPLLLVCGAGAALVASEPDLGSAIVIVCTVAAMLVAAGMPLGKLAQLALLLAGLVLLYALARPYARARLTSFLNPWAHASGSGFQAVQAQLALGSGGIFGVGPGRSVQKAFFLPEAPTDFILAVIGEELGLVGIAVLLGLYGLIAFVGLRVARKARSLYAALLAVGCTALITSQALLNVFAVLGLAPLTGVPLPLVSYGSTSMVVTLCACGLIQGVAAGQSPHLRVVAPRRAANRRAGGRARSRPPRPLASGRAGRRAR